LSDFDIEMNRKRLFIPGIKKMTQAHQPAFTKDWFSENIPQWQEILNRLAGMPRLRFLEIGVLEGRATLWLLTNILTHSTSRIICIDTFEGSIEHQAGMSHAMNQLDSLYDRFLENISPFASKVQVRKGLSQELLRKHRLDSFDFVYVDGSHRSADVLEDAVLSFRLLKSGGIMIFDDYEWKTYEGTLDNPRAGIDAFLGIFEGQYSVISKGYQVAISKC
jgi:hypothetical protein